MPGGGSRLPLGGSDVALRDLSDRACFPRRARHHPAYRGASPFPGDHRPRVFRTGAGRASGHAVRAARILFLLLAMLAAEAQEGGKIARIGYLGSSPSDPFVEAFRQGLRERGYIEGRNIAIEYRWTEGRFEALPSLAADLVRLKVDVIVASTQGAVAVKQATSTIPIVMPIITDPVRLGIVESLTRPGGNVEQPTKFELVINRKAATALGLTIPPVPAATRGSGHRSMRTVSFVTSSGERQCFAVEPWRCFCTEGSL